MYKLKIYNKLVRDKMPEIIFNKGNIPFYHKANNNEFRKALFAKLQEEVTEFLENPCPEEMADILEVINAIKKDMNWQPIGWQSSPIDEAKKQKFIERGGFSQGIILDRVINFDRVIKFK